MKYLILLLAFCVPVSVLHAQEKPENRINRFADFSATIGSSQGSLSLSWVNNWGIGARKKFEAGAGIRFTSYFGSKKDFLTAGPARLTRSFTFPFLIVFAGQQEKNFDTLSVQRPFINSLNLSVNLGYRLHPRWYAGFNIDVIGFSFGRKSSAVFSSNGTTRTEPAARPSAFNILLTGDHDQGSLNSEFFLKYRLSRAWQIKAVYQFLFVEYKTNSVKQVATDGTEITRFRNKANNLGLGVSYHW